MSGSGGGDGSRSITREEQDNELERQESKFNQYATTKTYQQGMLNTSLIQTQIGIFVSIFASTNEKFTGFQISLIVLLCISIALQFVIFVLLAILAKSTKTQATQTLSVFTINVMVTSFTGLLVIVTTAILSLTPYSTAATAATATTSSNNITQ